MTAGMTPGDLERLAAVGMYDPSAGDADAQRALLDEMVAQGLSVDVLVASPRLGGLVLQIFDQLIRPGTHVTLEEAAVSSGVKAADILRVRRAWGFPDPEPGERCLMEADVEALSFVRGVAELVGPELTLHLARATGTAMSRVAEAEIALIRSELEGREETRATSVASTLLRYRGVLEVFLPAMLRMLDAVHRGHLVHVGRRYSRWALPPSEYNIVDMVIGFADLTHSTALVSELDLAGLDRALTAFEAVTTDQIASAGATLVKRLGDGVMFVVPEADVACNLGRRLVEAMRDDPTALPVRVGLAAGHVLALRGDFYGPPVHLAARIVTAAPATTVLVSREVRDRASGSMFRSAGSHALAGFADAVELFELAL
jgi:class 3 adenylate cyclase